MPSFQLGIGIGIGNTFTLAILYQISRPLDLRDSRVVAEFPHQLVGMAHLRMGDFRAAVGRVDLAILPVSLVQNPVGIAEVRKVAVAHVEEDRLVLALEEVQTKFARLPKRSVNQDVRKEQIGGGLRQPSGRPFFTVYMLYTKIGKRLQANGIISFCLSRSKR